MIIIRMRRVTVADPITSHWIWINMSVMRLIRREKSPSTTRRPMEWKTKNGDFSSRNLTTAYKYWPHFGQIIQSVCNIALEENTHTFRSKWIRNTFRSFSLFSWRWSVPYLVFHSQTIDSWVEADHFPISRERPHSIRVRTDHLHSTRTNTSIYRNFRGRRQNPIRHWLISSRCACWM